MALSLPRIEMPAWLRLPAIRSAAGTPARGRALLEPKYPPVAFDIDHRSIAMVRIGRRKHESYIASWEVVELPPGVVELDFHSVRLTDPRLFSELVKKLVARDSTRIEEASLLLPDSYARVAILGLDQLPRRRREALEVIRWKIKKAVPFKVDGAAIDYMVLPGDGPGISVLAVITPQQVVEAFESIFGSMEIRTGLVDLSTLSLLNLCQPLFEREVPEGTEFMVANVSDGFVTFVIFRGQRMIFFRSKPFQLAVPGAGGLSEGEVALRLIRRELQTSLLYYREKLGGSELTRSYLRVVQLAPEAVAKAFGDEKEIGEVHWIDPRKMIGIDGRMDGDRGDRALQRLAPALGATLGRIAP
jgi:type IV pilus assembly protein PilM